MNTSNEPPTALMMTIFIHHVSSRKRVRGLPELYSKNTFLPGSSTKGEFISQKAADETLSSPTRIGNPIDWCDRSAAYCLLPVITHVT